MTSEPSDSRDSSEAIEADPEADSANKPSPDNDLPETTTTGKRKQAEWFELEEKKNSYVYVSGLPTDLSEEKFLDLMKNYGIIAKKPLPGHPFNIKMYRDKDGNFKGDALCCYARVESVDLAIMHLDGYLFEGKHSIHCERAKFELKGSYDPSKKPRLLDKRTKIKQKKTVDKLLSWEPKAGAADQPQRKVILKHMFTPEEITSDAELILEIKEDVEEKCTEVAAEPKRVDIFDKHPEGVVAVTFAEPEQAQACIRALDNYAYAGRFIRAELWDGKTKYKIKETDEESQKRVDKWHEDIQKSDDDDEDEVSGKDASTTTSITEPKEPTDGNQIDSVE